MPIYDYRCSECGTLSEILVRSSQTGKAECPACGGRNLKKLVSASYLLKTEAGAPGTTCCGRTERCETPPCSTEGTCHRD